MSKKPIPILARCAFALGCALMLLGSNVRAQGLLCQDRRTEEVRSFKACPPGTVEVFALERSGGGGYWTADGRWIGQVAPRRDPRPPQSRSAQNEDAHNSMLERAPNAR